MRGAHFLQANVGAPDADHTSAWSANIPWPSGADLPNGRYLFVVASFDRAGNGIDIVRSIVIGPPDTTTPALAIQTPADNVLLDSARESLTSISGTVSDVGGSGVATVLVQISRNWEGVAGSQIQSWDGTVWAYRGNWCYFPATLGAPDAAGLRQWNSTAPLPPSSQLPTGQYFITVLALDRSDNWGVTVHRLNVAPYDNVAPTVSVTFPTQNQEIYALPEIRGTSADVGSGVSEVRVSLWRQVPQAGGTLTEYWDGTKWDPVPSYAGILPPNTETGWTRNQNLPAGAQLPPGDYTVFAHALDRYSNISSNILRNFRVIAVPHLSIDAHLRTTNAEPWLGEGFSNSNAAGQTLGGTIARGETQTRQVRLVRHGGLESKTVRVTMPDWAAFAAAGWTASFTDDQNGIDITAQITSAGGWQTVMSDGDARQFRVEVTAPASASAGQERALTFRIEADPTSETSAIDVVKATWSVNAPTPDLSIRAGKNGSWLGETLVNADGANQTLERVADSSHVVRGQIKLNVANARNGQSVTWKVLDVNALRADGWNAKFFDTQNGNTEITGQIMGEGWATTHLNGFEPVIGWEVTAPANASNVTRVLSVRAQLAGGVADVVKASVRVLSNVQPDVSIRVLDENGLPGDWIGEGKFSPEEQRLSKVWGAGETYRFAVKIKNTGAQAAQFALTSPDPIQGWEIKFYNAPEGGTLFQGEIVTPSIEPNQSVIWRAEVKASAGAAQSSLPIRASGGDLFDEVEVGATIQRLIDIEWSADGKNWGSTNNGISPKSNWKQTVGLRAVKSNPGAPWPDSQPSGPRWRWDNIEAIGDGVWVEAVDKDANTGRRVSASLAGDSKTVNLYARPALKVSIATSAKDLLAGAGTSALKTTQLSIAVSSDNLVPIGSTKVRLQALSESAQNTGLWNGVAAPFLDVAVNANGAASATWTSGNEEGQIEFVATALDENDHPTKVSDVTYAQTHKPYTLLKTGNWREQNGVWSRTITASTRFKDAPLGGVSIGFSAQIKDYETEQLAQGWQNAAPFAVAAAVTDANGDFSTVQNWNPIEAGAWPHDYEVTAGVELR